MSRTPIFNPKAHKLVKEAMAEKMYKIQNDKCWEIYFRPLTDESVEVISYYQGDPFVNPRRFDKDMSKTKSTENVEVMPVEDARECWNLWVECQGFEVAEVEDFLRGGRSEWAGESFNYRKESKTASWCVPEG